MKKGDALDPKGLINDSYAIPGITLGECRSIFMDWALARPMDSTGPDAVSALLARFADGNDDHPMTQVLREGLDNPVPKGRRGGRAARMRQP